MALTFESRAWVAQSQLYYKELDILLVSINALIIDLTTRRDVASQRAEAEMGSKMSSALGILPPFLLSPHPVGSLASYITRWIRERETRDLYFWTGTDID